jgi:hypothetical protein
MSLRQKLLLLFSLTVALAVAAVAWTVLVRIRLVFEQRDREETALVVSQFQREFQHRSDEVAAAVDRIASREGVRSMAVQLTETGDASPFVTEAETLAQEGQLDFLEIIGPDGKIVSSAQWPARFGYAEPAAMQPSATFMKREELPDGTTHMAPTRFDCLAESGWIKVFLRICRWRLACRFVYTTISTRRSCQRFSNS